MTKKAAPMTTSLAPTTDSPPLGEPVSPTKKLLDDKHAILLRDIEALGSVRSYLKSNEQAEAAARKLLAEMAEAREFEGLLSVQVATAQDLLDAAAGRTGWQPPADGPLPIGDGIDHRTLTTLATPAVHLPELVEALVGQWVHLWAEGVTEPYAGFLARVQDGIAHLEDGHEGDLATVPVASVTGIEKWTSSDDLNRTLIADHPELLGDPNRRQDLPQESIDSATSGAQEAVRRTGNPPKGGK